jgi:xanthine dehydrogenase accessory factor
MKQLFSEVMRRLEAGEDLVLATIIASSGSTPRGAGARMLVGREGRLYGTVGGGAVEHRSILTAAEALASKSSKSRAFILRPNDVEDLGMICGGDVKIYFQYMPARGAQEIAFARHALACLEKREGTWLIADITDDSWLPGLYTKNRGFFALPLGAEHIPELIKRKPFQKEINGRLYYSEPFVPAGQVFVFGGGHISQELIPLLSRLDFRTVVFEERAEFCSAKLFPTADSLILGNFERIDDFAVLTPDDYAVVVTRGHTSDFAVQRQVLSKDIAYAGVIGSRGKIARVSARLRDAGIAEARIQSVHAPIGLAIKAQTPAEIAVSIAAELVLVRSERAEQQTAGEAFTN